MVPSENQRFSNTMKGIKGSIIGLLIIITIVLLISFFNSACNQSSFTITEKITNITPSFLEKPLNNLFEKSIAGESIGARMDRRSAQVTNLLGYGRSVNQSVCLFMNDLKVGLLTGLWIWLLYLIYFYENILTKKLTKYRSSKNLWLRGIGSSWYKAIAIGLAYAVLMQVPFLNAAIDIICFDFLADGFWFDVIIRSLLIAFYIGIGPTAYSEYGRYKMKKAYQYAVLRKKYESQAQKAWFEN